MAAEEALPAVFTVADAILLCGVDHPNNEMLATQVFMDDFASCKDMSNEDLADAFKTLSTLTVAQGQIRLLPAQKMRIKVFNQWVKDRYRTGLDPNASAFPVNQASDLIRRSKTLHNFYGAQ